jgi:acetyl-CoA carboxylase biotin carboxylase subunit
MFRKILIANRGEIALRIIRACRELGIRTVAVYSKADRDSLHIRYADEDICIGAEASSASYLHIPSIISAAEITDAEAIHPGYGFLSENAHFSEVCQSCHIKFIGPSPRLIRLMGDKIKAKEAMKKAGVPVIAGSDNAVKDKDETMAQADKIGYPVIIKAAGGGGGRGMRIAHNPVRLVNALMMAQTEAEASFGNPEVYIEKYIEQPRHVEFQIMGDRYGQIVHLGERDCTIQRRYQKLIEESPSPAVDERLRKEIGEAALKGARQMGYDNVGTMEFLLDKNGNYYFMEMNTRIQVEHPVTEMITDIDIVKNQILVSAGEKLPFRQEDVKLKGVAIECRINAEDTERDFRPCPGTITAFNVPGGPGVRVDTHAYQGFSISPYYDSMIAKLIVRALTREEAILRMQRALDEFVIEGIKTTIPFHQKVFQSEEFMRGQLYTDFVEHVLETR